MKETDDRNPAPTVTVVGLEPLKILSDPLRMHVVELLRQAPATVKQLAAILETKPRSLYYHINLLERHGLIRIVETRIVSGIVEKTYRATAYVFLFEDLTLAGSAGDATGASAGIDTVFRSTAEELIDSLRTGRVNSNATMLQDGGYLMDWNLLTLSSGDAASFASRLEALVEEYLQRGRDAATLPSSDEPQTYRLLCSFFRTYFRGARPEIGP